MFKPVGVRALSNYKLWLRYSDGAEGEVDLSEFAGRGVFKLWDEYIAVVRWIEDDSRSARTSRACRLL